MSLEYADEKFSDAVRMMATAREGIHQRLLDAVRHTIGFVRPGTLPSPVREEFEDLIERLTQIPMREGDAGCDGTFEATIMQISTDEAVELAGEICDFASRLERLRNG